MLGKQVKFCQIGLLLVLLCAPGAYGGMRAVKKPGKKGIVYQVARRVFHAKSRARVPRQISLHSRIKSVSLTSSKPTNFTRSPRLWDAPSGQASNLLSRSMQQKVARQARAYLDEIDWTRVPQQPASYSNVKRGIYTLGNLTRMSEEQYAKGKEAYERAVKYMQEVSKAINAEIYYLGTPEMVSLFPEQIRQRLSEISHGQDLVADARAIWGDNYTLVRVATYWKNMRDVYSTLGTGMLDMMEHGKLETVKRPDGHVYVAEEFGLVSEGIKAELPQVDWRDPVSWFGVYTKGALPERLRVAVLQDDKDVIASMKSLKKRAGLRKWTLDFYDDPEVFLNQGAYAQYNMILTDVLIQNGGGRYLARQLRSRGYEGSILTLSGFEVTHGGEEFFKDGIDGMISLGWTPNLTERIWASLNNYFILKKKYGWTH